MYRFGNINTISNNHQQSVELQSIVSAWSACLCFSWGLQRQEKLVRGTAFWHTSLDILYVTDHGYSEGSPHYPLCYVDLGLARVEVFRVESLTQRQGWGQQFLPNCFWNHYCSYPGSPILSRLRMDPISDIFGEWWENIKKCQMVGSEWASHKPSVKLMIATCSSHQGSPDQGQLAQNHRN